MERILANNVPVLDVIEPVHDVMHPLENFMFAIDKGQKFKEYLLSLKNWIYTYIPAKEGENIKVQFLERGIYFTSDWSGTNPNDHMHGYMYLDASKATKYNTQGHSFSFVFNLKDLLDMIKDFKDEFTLEWTCHNNKSIDVSIIQHNSKKTVHLAGKISYIYAIQKMFEED